MASNLDFRKGQTSFAYNVKRGLPWHGLGQSVEGLMTSEQCLVKANLDFDVELAKVYTLDVVDDDQDPDNPVVQEQMVPNSYVIRRSDDHTIFTTSGKLVSKDYKIFNNREAFSILDDITRDQKAVYETAGAIGNGEIVFITAALEKFDIINNDPIAPYLFAALYHTGSDSIRIGVTDIRIVCNNTLNMALHRSTSFPISHRGDMAYKVDIALRKLGLVTQSMSERRLLYKNFAKTEISDADFKTFVFNQVFDEEEMKLVIANNNKFNGIEEISSRKKNVVKAISNYYFNGIGQKEVVGTLWGAYNAVTGYVSNVKTYSNNKSLFTNLVEGNDIVQNSYNYLKELCVQ